MPLIEQEQVDTSKIAHTETRDKAEGIYRIPATSRVQSSSDGSLEFHHSFVHSFIYFTSSRSISQRTHGYSIKRHTDHKEAMQGTPGGRGQTVARKQAGSKRWGEGVHRQSTQVARTAGRNPTLGARQVQCKYMSSTGTVVVVYIRCRRHSGIFHFCFLKTGGVHSG